MQPSIDKKWFVFLGDRNEGPFSSAELEIKRDQGVVTRDSYVWTEGMGDWGQVRAIPDLQESFPDVPNLVPPSTVIDPSAAADKTVLLNRAPPSGGGFRKVLINVGVGFIFLGVAWIGWHVFQITRREGPRYWAFQAVDRFPDLGRWISPLPSLPDVSPEDYEDLKSAALGTVSQVGPKVTLALSKADLLNPKFFLASNLPDGTRFNVYVEGVTDTLLNTLSFATQLEAIVQKRLSLTPVLRYPDGRLIARGEYKVYVVEGEQQPPDVEQVLKQFQPKANPLPATIPRNRKVVAYKTMFLGGAQDQTYQDRLKEYHDKVKAKAVTELAEVKQFLATLESQINMSTSNFSRLRKGRGGAARQGWNDFHERWAQLDQQIKDSFSKWTPESLQNDFFYGALFQRLQQLNESAFRLHEIQNSYFGEAGATPDRSTLDIQLGVAESQVQVALATLRLKLEVAEKWTPEAGGLPTREGL